MRIIWSDPPPSPSIFIESPDNVQADESPVEADKKSACEQSLSIILDAGGQFGFMGADSALVLDTAAVANLARFRSLARRN